VANFVVPMLSAYPPISIAMDITIAPMKVTKQIARQSRVPTTNSSALMEDPIERRSASRNLSCAMENAIARMELMKSRRVRRLPAQLSDVNTSVDLL
jgi:hypothetical protein